ncbi:MAG TPA: nucleotide exchange factor GrpE [Candidatus Saccharimonadales bacterium]
MKKSTKLTRSSPVAQLEAKVAELTDDLQRARADFINYKQRAEVDKHRSVQFGRESAVMSLLPIIDNIERALSHLPPELKSNEWAQGVKSIAKQLQDSLKGVGVEKINSIAQPFDPNLHEAIELEDGTGHKETVVEELQPGYTMDGEVIRHAIVKVKRGK